MTSLSLFAVLALLPVVSASGSTCAPAWSSSQPKRVLNIVAKADAKDTANGFADVTITGNVVLGDGAKHGSALGRGLQDFQKLTWDASEADATPVADAPLDQGAEAYRLPVDLNGKMRKASLVTSGAVTR